MRKDDSRQSQANLSGSAESAAEPIGEPVEVPMEALDDVILMRIIEEFVLREGTDYGANEVALETKKAQVLKSLQSQDVKIFFDPESQSVNLVKVRKGL